MRPVLIAAALILSSGLAGAASTDALPVGEVGDLASLLEGEFTTDTTTAGQVYYELSKRVEVPSLGHDVVYSELRQGGPEGHVVRQRLYALTPDSDSGKIVMTAYSFANGPELAGAHADHAPLAKVAPADLKPEGCKLDWHKTEAGFDAIIPRLSCTGAPSSSPDAPVMSVSKTGLSVPLDGGYAPTALRRLR